VKQNDVVNISFVAREITTAPLISITGEPKLDVLAKQVCEPVT
jgi:hypothetical protein